MGVLIVMKYVIVRPSTDQGLHYLHTGCLAFIRGSFLLLLVISHTSQVQGTDTCGIAYIDLRMTS